MSEQNKPFVSVQPENRTIIEEGLEYGWHKVISQQPNPYPNLKQPSYTPDEFVSLLASERGVLDWQPSDTLEQRRKTADKAFEIHRKAGTRHGLTVAMEALDCDLEIIPWFQKEQPSPPYELDVIAWRNNTPITKELADRVTARIDHTKSERDTINLSLALGMGSGFVVSGALSDFVIVADEQYDGHISPSPEHAGPLQLLGALYHSSIDDQALVGTPPDGSASTGAVYFSGAIRTDMITEIILGVKK